MATDQELVEQVRRGEREAYAELFQKYYDYIYVICLSIVNNPQDAEELAQEMFVHAYFKLDQLRNPARFFPWLKKMAHNRSRNYAQRTKARIIQMPFKGMQQKTAAPDEELLRREMMEAIMEAIEALPAKDREVIRARIDGLDHAEISERFGISVETSMTRLSRARKRLAGHLKGLCSIFGLSKVLHLKKIISGGVVAMKIGIGAKATIGVIGVLVVGFVWFQMATRQPDEAILPNQAIQETSAKSSEKLEASQQTVDKKEIQTQAEGATASPDSSKESVTAVEAKEFVAFLDQLSNQADPEEIVEPKEKKRSSGLTPARRAELETRMAIMEDELKTELADLISIGDEMQEYLQSRGQNPADDSADKWNWYVNTDREVQEKWTEICDVKINAYIGIRLLLEGKNFRHPLATGGFLYEMAQRLPPNMVPRSVSGNGYIDRIPDRRP